MDRGSSRTARERLSARAPPTEWRPKESSGRPRDPWRMRGVLREGARRCRMQPIPTARAAARANYAASRDLPSFRPDLVRNYFVFVFDDGVPAALLEHMFVHYC